MSTTVVGIDVGGTFTDIAVLRDGVLSVHKLPSTPANPSVGITTGIGDIDVDVATTDFIHGSTVATNALLEGKGGRTALVTTMGFEDVLEIGRQNRADLYDLFMERPTPLAPWQLRFGLPERIDYTGAILDDLNAGIGGGAAVVAGRRSSRWRRCILPVLLPQPDTRGDAGPTAVRTAQQPVHLHLVQDTARSSASMSAPAPSSSIPTSAR